MPRYDISREEQYLFIEGYTEAMLWANTWTQREDGEIESVDALTGSYELSEEAQKALEQDCFDFLTPQVVRLIWGAIRRAEYGYSLQHAGHDFALTRNGHGAGYWDRGLGIVGDALSEIARPYGTRSLVLIGETVEIGE